MFSKELTSVSYKNDVFFKFALFSEDDSQMIHYFIFKERTGINPIPMNSVVVNAQIINDIVKASI